MARRQTRTAKASTTRRKPKAAALPGMEDHAIKPLENLAHEYAVIRDQRMELTTQEHALKVNAVKLMHKYGKTIYQHDGVTITLVMGEEDVKVRVKKPGDDDKDDDTGESGDTSEFADARRDAVEAED